jgi:lipopolysaccharide biosynthesis protein
MRSSSNHTSKPRLIKTANEAFAAGNYSEALALYLDAIEQDKNVARLFRANIILAKKRIGADEQHSKKKNDWVEEDLPIKLTYKSAFDFEWYLENNSDVANSDIDPLDHYYNWGWKEGRWPNPWFNPLFYTQMYPDVLPSGLEPLEHYVEIGYLESRMTKKIGRRKIIPDEIQRVTFSDVQEDHVEYRTYQPFDCAIKCIAFYLPQFHPFSENDKWWGKGFTEWTNVTKAKPNYEGHHHPHLPIHLGFYDLRLAENLEEQAKLAKNYGIYGFNFYYYWFDGKVLMNKPFEILLENPQIDINYCLTWANENWTRRWDGAESDILISQNHSEADSLAFIKNLLKFFKDRRYITIDKKPVLTVYRPEIIPDISKTLELWRQEVKKAGFPDLYLVAAQTFVLIDPTFMGFDAAVEFPPHTVVSDRIEKELKIINKNYDGHIYSYEQSVENSVTECEVKYRRFRTAMLSWDNTARKQDRSHIFHGFSITLYKQWLDHICNQTFNNPDLKAQEKLIFVNAWNEWAEGTHLEPDQLHGFGYLEATRNALVNYDKKFSSKLSALALKKSQFAVIIHAHYFDLWDSYSHIWQTLKEVQVDVYITLTKIDQNMCDQILNTIPQANIRLVENRGRDILPFVGIYKEIKKLGYSAVCKMHLKKSPYRPDGSILRDRLIHALIGSKEIFLKCAESFNSKQRLGLLLDSQSAIKHSQKNMLYNRENTTVLAQLLKFKFSSTIFPAGSMFWFRPEALSGLELLQSDLFEMERGLTDGTIAHAVERLFCKL